MEISINLFTPDIPVLEYYANRSDPVQMLHFAASNQGLHCLPTEFLQEIQ